MRLLFTGCGRSGTKYVSRLITEAGLPCGHELAFNSCEVCGWEDREAESSSYALRAVEDGMVRDCLIVHLVRDPLDVIRSVVGIDMFAMTPHRPITHYTAWLCANVPQCFEAGLTQIASAARYWLYVNQRTENRVGYRLRVEDIDEVALRELSETIGKPLDVSAVGRVPKDVNHRQRDELVTWDQVLSSLDSTQRGHFESMAERYGYARQLAQA